ncbi:MAG: cellobiose phosphorylase, partial [Candidatus Omnitrophica bacterium]|nr:cellobiose phosphorylase [Candidatus Omnitrophota bacterium]
TPVSKIYACIAEYFNLEGRGMYSYLTGSASWFVLTMLTEAFGVKGRGGDLLIQPKLSREQFRHALSLSLKRIFAGRRLEINFSNPKKLEYGSYKIIKVRLNSQPLAFAEAQQIIISRRLLLRLPPDRINTLNITLG